MTKSLTNSNPLLYLLRSMWRYSPNNRINIVTFWVMFTVGTTIKLFAEPFMWAEVINTATHEGVTNSNISKLLLLLGGVFMVNLIFWFLHGPGRIMENTNAFKARIAYRKYLLQGILNLPMDWHVNHHSGDTIDRVEKGASGLHNFSEYHSPMIASAIQFVGSYAVLIYFSPSSAIIVLVMMLISIWITMRIDRVLIGQYKQLNRYENAISESILDAISNVATVITLRVERLVFDAIVHRSERPLELFEYNTRLSEFKWFLTSICCTTMTAGVLAIYFWQNIGADKGVLVGSVYLLINYLNQIGAIFFDFTGKYGQVLQRRTKVANSEELAADFTATNFTNHVLPHDWEKLDISNLSFSYGSDTEAELSLNDISLSLERGKRYAFIGETGSGKTTCLKVIRDLYHPRSLSLRVDGAEIPDGFAGICRAISLVPQNPEIFATTMLGNITLGAEYKLSTILRYANMACFMDVVRKLPKRWKASIREKGVNLSGGQQQRLALTRGLLASQDKSIILLDEPTSSLDPATEHAVYQNIFNGFIGETIVSTVHRLHLLPMFDYIYMFEKGCIIASGTLPELLASSPEFVKLWQKGQVASEVWTSK